MAFSSSSLGAFIHSTFTVGSWPSRYTQYALDVYSNGSHSVVLRRYSDFEHTLHELHVKWPGKACVSHDLMPEKSLFALKDSVVTDRKACFNKLLRLWTKDGDISSSPELSRFLGLHHRDLHQHDCSDELCPEDPDLRAAHEALRHYDIMGGAGPHRMPPQIRMVADAVSHSHASAPSQLTSSERMQRHARVHSLPGSGSVGPLAPEIRRYESFDRVSRAHLIAEAVRRSTGPMGSLPSPAVGAMMSPPLPLALSGLLPPAPPPSVVASVQRSSSGATADAAGRVEARSCPVSPVVRFYPSEDVMSFRSNVSGNALSASHTVPSDNDLILQGTASFSVSRTSQDSLVRSTDALDVSGIARNNTDSAALASTRLDGIDTELLCPITGDLMLDCVVLVPCGHSFSDRGLSLWLTQKNTCPVCRTVAVTPMPNYGLRRIIENQQKQRISSVDEESEPDPPLSEQQQP